MTSLGPEVIGHIGSFKITNTLITTLVTDAVLLGLVFTVQKNLKKVPGKLQSIFELIVNYFYDLTEQLSGDKAKSVFPWVATFFIFILTLNFIGLLPGVGSIGFFEKVHEEGHEVVELIPLFRAATSDFNTTFALAAVSLVATHVLSIKYTGVGGYLKRFFSLNPILLFVGLLELVSEFTKMFSLSFRLFGNIFAGEIALHTVSTLSAFTGFLVPIPFLLLEVIVAIVQALVFSMLTMVFMSLMVTSHEGGEH